MTKTEYGFMSEIPLPLNDSMQLVSKHLIDTGFEIYPNWNMSKKSYSQFRKDKASKKVFSVFNSSLITKESSNENVVLASSRIIAKETGDGQTQFLVFDPTKIMIYGDDNKDQFNIAGKAQARLAAAFFNLAVSFFKE